MENKPALVVTRIESGALKYYTTVPTPRDLEELSKFLFLVFREAVSVSKVNISELGEIVTFQVGDRTFNAKTAILLRLMGVEIKSGGDW
jgi:hypothetical protein